MNRISLYGYALLAFSLLVGSLMPIAYSLGSAIPFTTLIFYVSVVGTITSFVMMMVKGTASHLKNFLKDRTFVLAIVAVGLFQYTIESFGLGYATHYVTADLTAVIFRTWTIMLVVIAPFIIKEKVTKWDMLGVLVGFSVLAVTLIGGTAVSLPVTELPFVAVLLVVAFGDAFANSISKRYNYELASSVFGYNLVALAVFAPLALFTNTWRLTVTTPSVILSILFIGGIFFGVFGYTFIECLRLIKTSVFSTSYLIVPFITMLISAVFLHVPALPSYILIGVGVAAGVLIQRLNKKSTGNFVVSKKRKEYSFSLFDVTGAFINTKNPEIYQTMKGGGRVLAINLDRENAGALTKDRLDGMSSESCILFTDRYHTIASQSEIGFIREIMGSTDRHMLVMGSGNPENVMDKFAQIDELVGNGRQGIF